MSADKTLAWAYAEEQSVEDELFEHVRYHGDELGIPTMSPATGSLLRILASQASTAVEVGTGVGVSGLYLLSANPSMVLTTIDVDAEAQRLARDSFARGGHRPSRTRLIRGRSADILPRLAGSAYDVVLLDGDVEETPGDVEEALRILRPGGLLVIERALLDGRVADPAKRDAATTGMRHLIRDLGESSLVTSLVPVGSGLLIGRKPS